MKVSLISLAIAAVLVVGGSVSYVAFTPYVFADESETNTEQSIAQENIGSGESTNLNCGENSIDAASAACSRGSGGDHPDLS